MGYCPVAHSEPDSSSLGVRAAAAAAASAASELVLAWWSRTRAFWAGHPDLPARFAQTGQPVIVPGDMGRQSFVLAAQPGAADTFGSCCHGAGRRLSRTAARREYDGRALIDELAAQGIVVRATSDAIAAEEAPGSYKDVADVVGSVEAAGIARRVARLRPLGVVKG